MHSSLVRAQNVFGFFTTVAFSVAALIALSDLLSPRAPKADITVGNLQVVRGRPHYYSTKKEEYAHIRFDLDADLSSLFTWNTKQVFVYVTASWPANTTSSSTSPSSSSSSSSSTSSSGSTTPATALSASIPLNEALIWDAIIPAPSSDHLSTLPASALKKLRRATGSKAIDPSRGLLKLKNQKGKYAITAPGGRIAELDDVRLMLGYNVQPWVGVLSWRWLPDFDLARWTVMSREGRGSGVSKAFRLPALKVKEKGGTA